MKNIAIYGGAFNPPTLAHKNIVNKILELDIIDEVWVIPVYKHKFNKSMVDFSHRYEMCREVFSPFKDVEVMSVDKLFNTYSDYDGSTYMLMNNLNTFCPDNNFYIVIGEDNAKIINKWNNHKELMLNYNFITFGRDTEIESNEWYKKEDNIFIEYNDDISSTMVRNYINEQKPISELVDKRTESYILNKKIY